MLFGSKHESGSIKKGIGKWTENGVDSFELFIEHTQTKLELQNGRGVV